MKQKLLQFFQNIKLVYAVIFGVVVGAIIPAIIFGLLIIQIDKSEKISALKQFASNTIENIAIGTRGHMWDIRQDLAQELIDSIAKDPRIKHIQIIDATTNTIFVQSKEKQELIGQTYQFKQNILHDGTHIGHAILVVSDDSTQAEIDDMQFHFLIIFLAQLIVIIVLIIVQLYFKILKPLTRLNTQASYFYKNKLNVAFEWDRQDEIGLVGKNFENARAELYELHALSKQYEQKLIEEVAIKTKQLQELNETLEQRVVIEIEKNKKQNIMLQQQTRLAALGEMIGNIAHQWRQPLSAITTHASSLQLKHQLGITDENDIHHTTEGIIKSAKFLSQTIEDFRNFLKNDKVKEHFNIASVVYEIFHIVKGTFDSRQITTLFAMDDSLEYDGYPNELSQVILNILNNARDALVINEIDNKFVKIELFQNDDTISLILTDNAGGIPDHILNKIFDPYFTTKHQHQGTGIGLYMSMQIIQDNFKGKIFVENKEISFEETNFIGASFTIELPRLNTQ